MNVSDVFDRATDQTNRAIGHDYANRRGPFEEFHSHVKLDRRPDGAFDETSFTPLRCCWYGKGDPRANPPFECGHGEFKGSNGKYSWEEVGHYDEVPFSEAHQGGPLPRATNYTNYSTGLYEVVGFGQSNRGLDDSSRFPKWRIAFGEYGPSNKSELVKKLREAFMGMEFNPPEVLPPLSQEEIQKFLAERDPAEFRDQYEQAYYEQTTRDPNEVTFRGTQIAMSPFLSTPENEELVIDRWIKERVLPSADRNDEVAAQLLHLELKRGQMEGHDEARRDRSLSPECRAAQMRLYERSFNEVERIRKSIDREIDNMTALEKGRQLGHSKATDAMLQFIAQDPIMRSPAVKKVAEKVKEHQRQIQKNLAIAMEKTFWGDGVKGKPFAGTIYDEFSADRDLNLHVAHPRRNAILTTKVTA